MEVLDLSRKPFGINATRKITGGAVQQCMAINSIIENYVEPHIDNLSTVKILDLSDNQLEDLDFIAFMNELKNRNFWDKMVNIELIDLSRNYISDTSIFAELPCYILLTYNHVKRNRRNHNSNYDDKIITLHASEFKYKFRSTNIHKSLIKYRQEKKNKRWIDFVGDEEVAEYLVKNHHKITNHLRTRGADS